MDITNVIEMIGNFGVLVIIAGIFLWEHITSKKKIADTLDQNSKMLEEMRNTNCNTAKSLELLQESMNTQKDFLYEHDKRCGNIERSIQEINLKMK